MGSKMLVVCSLWHRHRENQKKKTIKRGEEDTAKIEPIYLIILFENCCFGLTSAAACREELLVFGQVRKLKRLIFICFRDCLFFIL
jgi:hypothetical protein